MKDNVDIFKGPKGDTGEQGPAGQETVKMVKWH